MGWLPGCVLSASTRTDDVMMKIACQRPFFYSRFSKTLLSSLAVLRDVFPLFFGLASLRVRSALQVCIQRYPTYREWNKHMHNLILLRFFSETSNVYFYT